MATPVTLVDATTTQGMAFSVDNPLPVTGLGSAAAEASLTAIETAIGATDDVAWNGTDPDATVISLLKAIALNTDTA